MIKVLHNIVGDTLQGSANFHVKTLTVGLCNTTTPLLCPSVALHAGLFNVRLQCDCDQMFYSKKAL